MILNPLSPVNLQPSQELGSSGNQQLRRKHKNYLKLFSSIGGLQARINFLHTCVSNDVIPNGFKINWKEQTGLKSPSLSSKVSAVLSSASIFMKQYLLVITLLVRTCNITSENNLIIDVSEQPNQKSWNINCLFRKVCPHRMQEKLFGGCEYEKSLQNSWCLVEGIMDIKCILVSTWRLLMSFYPVYWFLSVGQI